MTPRILRVLIYHEIGLVENPIWQIAKVKGICKKGIKINPWTPYLVPLETFAPDGKINSNDEFQTFLSLENLTSSPLIEKLEANHKVQIWVDRIISVDEASMLEALFNAYQNIDLVYLPDLHFHPQQVFGNLKSHSRLLIQVKLKKTSFEKWLSTFEMWDRISWLKQSNRFQTIGLQILETQIAESISKTELLFLLNPTYENMMLDLKSREKTQYWTQCSAKAVLKVLGPDFATLFRLIIWTILRPNRRNWLALYNDLRNRIRGLVVKSYWFLTRIRNAIIFYPIRKIYWIIEHAFRKRILRKKNESD